MNSTTQTREALATASLQLVAGQRMADSSMIDGYSLAGVFDAVSTIAEGIIDAAARMHVAALDAEAGDA